jgi:hypothetical protein
MEQKAYGVFFFGETIITGVFYVMTTAATGHTAGFENS